MDAISVYLGQGSGRYQGAPWRGQWLSSKIAAQGLGWCGAYRQQLTFCL
jgi:hypothetical protein